VDFGKILIVDDDERIRGILRCILQRHGALVAEAADGEAARSALIENDSFGLAVIDVNIPRLSGLRVVAMARAAGRDTPFLLITGDADDDLRKAAAELGNAAVLEKPFAEDRLVAAIEHLLAMAGREGGMG
jgi:DNA-binding response OmpR family regulator